MAKSTKNPPGFHQTVKKGVQIKRRGIGYGPRAQTRSRSDLNAAVRKAHESQQGQDAPSKLACPAPAVIQYCA